MRPTRRAQAVKSTPSGEKSSHERKLDQRVNLACKSLSGDERREIQDRSGAASKTKTEKESGATKTTRIEVGGDEQLGHRPRSRLRIREEKLRSGTSTKQDAN
jgi:hypothetical protein